MVYETPADSDMKLLVRILVVLSSVREIPGILHNVRKSMQLCCLACLTEMQQIVGISSTYCNSVQTMQKKYLYLLFIFLFHQVPGKIYLTA